MIVLVGAASRVRHPPGPIGSARGHGNGRVTHHREEIVSNEDRGVLAASRLLLGGTRKDQAARGDVRLLQHPDEHPTTDTTDRHHYTPLGI